MSDRRTFVTIKAKRNDIFSLMRKTIGTSADNMNIWDIEWSDHDNGWLIEFSEAFQFDIWDMKHIFANTLVVGEKAIILGVKRGR